MLKMQYREWNRRKILWWMLIIVQLIIVIYACYVYYKSSWKEEPAELTFDLLAFVQQWPLTYCAQWQELSNKNKCWFPPDRTAWTIHGIWPTKKGTRGPSYCKSVPFNKTALDPLLKNLTNEWAEIQYNESPYNFWKHEWRKHGTCAAQIQVLNTEVKYFSQALEWLQKYNMRNILANASMYPSTNLTGYHVTEFWYAVKNETGKGPFISCVYDKATKKHFISEIYICFNTDLELVDCDGLRSQNKRLGDTVLYTNCPLQKLIIFPARVPSENDTTYLENEENNNLGEGEHL